MSGGFFRGTSAEQDTRFSNKMAKLLKTQKFAPELDQLVDISKVQMDVIKPWIATRVTELLGFEDEVLINFIYGLLDGKDVDGKGIQIQLTGFMEKNTGRFMKELWGLLTSAQSNQSGIPQQFLDAKAEETKKKKEEDGCIEEEQRILSEVQKREEQDKESDLERHGKNATTETVPTLELVASPPQDGEKKTLETPNEPHSGARNGSPVIRRARSRSNSRTPPRRRHSVSPHRRARSPRAVRSPPRRRRSPVYSRSPPRRRKSPPSRSQQFGRSTISTRRRSPVPSRSPPRRRLGRSRSPRRRRSLSASPSASPQRVHKSLSRSPPHAGRKSPVRSPARPRVRGRKSPSRSPRFRTRRRSPSRSPRPRRRSPSRSPPPPLRARRRSPSRSPVALSARARRRSPSRSPLPPSLPPQAAAHARKRSISRSPLRAPPHRPRRKSLSTSPLPRARRSLSREPVRPNGGLDVRRELARERSDRTERRDAHEQRSADKREQERVRMLEKPDQERGTKLYPEQPEQEQAGARVALDKPVEAGNVPRGTQERPNLERNSRVHTEKLEQEQGTSSRGAAGRVDQDRSGLWRSDRDRSSSRKQLDPETVKRQRSVSPSRGDVTDGRGQHMRKSNDVHPPSTPNHAVVEDDKGSGGSKPEQSGAHVDSDGDDPQAGKGAAVEDVKVPKILKARDIVKDEKDESMSPKSSDDRKESRRRKREEKRVRKEEKRKKREERHKRKEGKRAARAAAKFVDSKGEEKDNEKPAGKDVYDGSDGGEQSEDDDVESEQKRLRIENDLRKKALDSLRAKKAVS